MAVRLGRRPTLAGQLLVLQLAIVVIVVLSRRMEDPVAPDPTRPFDTVGAILSAAGLVLLVMGILQAENNLVITAALLVAGCVATVEAGIELAAQAIDTGAAQRVLDELVATDLSCTARFWVRFTAVGDRYIVGLVVNSTSKRAWCTPWECCWTRGCNSREPRRSVDGSRSRPRTAGTAWPSTAARR